jgi:hypothetical protein
MRTSLVISLVISLMIVRGVKPELPLIRSGLELAMPVPVFYAVLSLALARRISFL